MEPPGGRDTTNGALFSVFALFPEKITHFVTDIIPPPRHKLVADVVTQCVVDSAHYLT